jgi:short subunit dehydrogenase-like uncharacterized protein
MPNLMIYGANGYTGRLIAREAVKRGLKPMLAGRNRDEIAQLSGELGLLRRVFELSGAKEIERNLDGIDVVLHCAGPFSKTAAPMLEACLSRKVHYLDITGEIDVFALCHRAGARAKEAGIVVLPGSGFRCRADRLPRGDAQRRLPDATSLVLGFEAGGGPIRARQRPASSMGAAGGAHQRRSHRRAAGLEVARIVRDDGRGAAR